METIAKVFAHNLRRLRGTRTQSEQAERLGMSSVTYQKLESGNQLAQSATITQLAGALGVGETSLFVDPDLRPAYSNAELLDILAGRLDAPIKEPNILDRLDAKKQLFYTQLIQDMESGDVAALEKELAEFLEKEQEK